MQERRKPILTLLAALAMVVVGCGDESSSTPEAQPPDVSAPATGALAKKPKIAKPKGPAPEKLVIQDLVKGKGRAAQSGDQISTNYVGVFYKTGKQLDSSWDGGMPIDFQLGTGNVIPAWDEGIVGMKVGGRRKLVVPANKAYGAEGDPPDIPPNSPLIFVIDLLAIQ